MVDHVSMQASEFVFDGRVDDKWGEYWDEGRSSDEEDEEEEEEDEYESFFESKITGRKNFVPSALAKFEHKSFARDPHSRRKEIRDREAAAIEQRKQQFRKLIGMDVRKGLDGESIKTVISREDVEEEKTEEEKSSSGAGSHVCLKMIDATDSKLGLSSVDSEFPTTEDPVMAFSTTYPTLPSYKDDGVQKFFDLVKEMELRPINSMRDMLQTDTLNLRYYGLDPRIVEPICEAISRNTSIQTIDFTDNWLTADACYHISGLLVSNDVISCLNLSGCRIGTEGAKELQDGIAGAPSLVDLNLSGCKIGDEGLRYVATAISHNNVLENVDLSDNDLRENGAEFLGTMLTQTDSLKRLDLSWNRMNEGKFAEIFFQGLARNSTLEYLNISENGLGEDFAKFLSSYLNNSQSLREFDLSGNRFTASDGIKIAEALFKNTGLEILRLGNNPLEASGALALVDALTPNNSPDLQMRLLDLENVWANKDVIPSLEKIQRERSWLNIKLGGILSNYKLLGPDKKKIFLRRANFEAMNAKKKKQRRDFGHFVLTLRDEVVSTGAFKDSVKKFKLKLTESLVDELARAFEITKDQVDLASLREIYLKEYPETRPPPPESGKESKKSVKKKIDKKK